MRSVAHIDLLRALEVFMAIADTGSMTRASRLLHITQSAISQQLKLLEAEFGTTLVDRNNRPLRLTPAGISLRQHATQMLAQADRARAEVRQAAAGPLAHLRVAMFSTLAKTLAPSIMAEVVSRKLAVHTISIMRGTTAYTARELLERDVDVLITSNALYDFDGLVRHELIHERYILVIARDAKMRNASLRELASRLPFVRYSPRTGAGRQIEQHLRRHKLDVPYTCAFDSPEDLFAMVEMSRGWALTAPTHVLHALKTGRRLDLVALPKPAFGRGITLVARAGELGDVPARLAALCRRTLSKEYIPRAKALMPDLPDHLTIIDEPSQPKALP